ncbi:hypothetical protein Bca52824_069890 [Brassica carinata]|nr:hypothetical protein Bca52824_069890 [Brassica carinata]
MGQIGPFKPESHTQNLPNPIRTRPETPRNLLASRFNFETRRQEYPCLSELSLTKIIGIDSSPLRIHRTISPHLPQIMEFTEAYKQTGPCCFSPNSRYVAVANDYRLVIRDTFSFQV